MREIVQAICPNIHRNEAALDVLASIHGEDNFNHLREKISMINMIKGATIIHTSRIEKETAKHERFQAGEERKKSVRAAQYQLDVAKTEKIRIAAENRGCKVQISCPSAGKIEIPFINYSS
jgi:hypothetical protein